MKTRNVTGGLDAEAQRDRGIAFASVVLSVVLYLFALGMPAVLFTQTASGKSSLTHELHSRLGADLLLNSILGIFVGNFAGLANPLLLAGWILLLLRRTRAAAVVLLVAALFSIQTFQMMVQGMLLDEAGVQRDMMVRPLAGYYLWTASILVPLLVALREWLKRWRLKRLNEPGSGA